MPVTVHMDAETALGFPIGRAVVVGQIKVRNAAVKGRAQNGLLRLKRRDFTEIVPQSEGQFRKKQSAAAAAGIRHGVVTRFAGNVRHSFLLLE